MKTTALPFLLFLAACTPAGASGTFEPSGTYTPPREPSNAAAPPASAVLAAYRRFHEVFEYTLETNDPARIPEVATGTQARHLHKVIAANRRADHCLTLPETPRTSTADVAQMAMDAIALPPPRPHTSPRGRTFVGLRTFLWIDRNVWRSHHAAVSVDGQTVGITGRPTHVVWDMGEATRTCQGPGVPHRPTCSYAYGRSAAYRISATIYYAVDWTCAGACDAPSGTFGPLPATTSMGLRVTEIQTSAR